jgi:hypothetical protein
MERRREPVIVTNNAERKKIELYHRTLSMICFSGEVSYGVSINNFKMSRTQNRKEMEEWDITDSDSFERKLDWLFNQGRREKYNKQAHFLMSLSESERAVYIQSLPEDHVDKTDLTIVNYYLRRLPSAGIAAVDFAWAILICNAGLTFSYMTTEEYWTFILRIVHAAQRSYSGWGEFAASFAAGVQYIDGDTTFKYSNQKKHVITKLLGSKYSLFRQVDWNMELAQISVQ